jgi:hypothetical protein
VKTSIVLLTILCWVVFVFAQGAHPIPPGIRQADQTLDKAEKNVPPPLYQRSPADLAKLKRDADELASLAQSIPPGVEQTTTGVLPKDLADRLKRIEKLAKQLRSRISQ